jgi:L-threonylcarbamoyladenylate synthase
MNARHYAPKATLRVIDAAHLNAVLREAGERAASGARVGALTYSCEPPDVLRFARRLDADAAAYGAALYDALHAADAADCDELLVEAVPDAPTWDAIRDRLTRAAHPA